MYRSIGRQCPQVLLLVFCLCFILVNPCWGFVFVLLWQTSMNALIITETATHRRSAPTRLEALPVPVLTDILATGSPVQVTKEILFYIFPYFVTLNNILKYFCQLFTSMGKVTAQQVWDDIYRRFISMIFATKISYLIYIQFITYENIGSPVN